MNGGERARLRVAVGLSGALAAGAAAWLSLGALAVTSETGAASRVGVLPPLWLLAAFLVVSCAVVAMRRPAPASAAPLFLTLLLWLPWLPGSIPASFALWTGPSVALVWIAVGVCIAAERLARADPARRYAWLRDAGRAPLAAGAIALTVYLLVAWNVSHRLPGGDEPHYLVIAQSLLYDGDLQIENNHQRGDYRTYFRRELRPHYLRRGANGQIYSVHAPGLGALVAPAFLIAGHPGVRVFLSLISAAGVALAWRLAYALTGSVSAAWFGWAAVALSAPFLFHAFAIYPESPAAVLALIGLWCATDVTAGGRASDRPVSTGRLVAGGAALAALPWLHTRYAVLSAALGLLVALRLFGRPRRLMSLAAFLAAPAASAAAWFTYFYVVYGRFDPTIQYGGYNQGSRDHVLTSLTGMLFDQQFGILFNAPVYLVASLALVVAHRPGSGTDERPWRVTVELLLVTAAYLFAVATYPMWWGGSSAPARFVVPVLLIQVIAAALVWARLRSAVARAMALVALGASLAIAATIASVDHGQLAYNQTDGISLFFEWLNRAVDLPLALPSLHRDDVVAVWRQVAAWMLVPAGAWVATMTFGRRMKTTSAAAALAVAVCAVGIMGTLQVVWARQGISGFTPALSQLDLLRGFQPRLQPLGVRYAPPSLLRAEDALALTQIPPSDRAGRWLLSRDVTHLLAFPLMPAGEYRLHVDAPVRRGELTLRVGRMPAVFDRVPLAALGDRGAIDVRLPVDVHSLQVLADDEARLAVRRLWLAPVRVASGAAGYARNAVRYGATTVFFLDENVWPESTGFWVRGGSAATLVVSPVEAGRLQWRARNGAAATTLRLVSGDWHANVPLQPHEAHVLDVPVNREDGIALLQIESERGFRPSDVNPSSPDRRFLGVWVEPAAPVARAFDGRF
jgi:hypothetical protein